MKTEIIWRLSIFGWGIFTGLWLDALLMHLAH